MLGFQTYSITPIEDDPSAFCSFMSRAKECLVDVHVFFSLPANELVKLYKDDIFTALLRCSRISFSSDFG